MGVLKFSGPLHQRYHGIDLDILSLEADEIELQNELNEIALQNINISQPTKRKRTKSLRKSYYDFRDYGVDARRRGAKHQRRKQNFCDLLEMNTLDDTGSDMEDHATLFSDLFLDDFKMKAWEDFMRLTEEEQMDFLEKKVLNEKETETSSINVRGKAEIVVSEGEEVQFQRIDKRIRDMLRSKSLSHMGLLEYYENDMMYCTAETFPSVLVFNLESSYDRMLVYALCQYMGLASNTIKLKNSAIIEIDVPSNHDQWAPPAIKLTEFLKAKVFTARKKTRR